jgi:hypothetical protein
MGGTGARRRAGRRTPTPTTRSAARRSETTSWRSPPVNDPENALLGVMFSAWENPPAGAWVVQGASAWPYQGTGVKDGDSIPGIVG